MFYALGVQGAAVLAGAGVAWKMWDLPVLPFVYGGVVAMVNAGLLVWRWRAGLRDFHCDGYRHLQSFRRSIKERFFVVGVLLAAGFAFGLVQPGFQPLTVLTGFIVGQLAWMIAAAALKTE